MRPTFWFLTFLAVVTGCNIPIYSAKHEYYGDQRLLERELYQMLPTTIATEEANVVLKKNGFEVELFGQNDNDSTEERLVATRQTAITGKNVRVLMPIRNGQIARPFRIEWINVATNEVVSSEVTKLTR